MFCLSEWLFNLQFHVLVSVPNNFKKGSTSCHSMFLLFTFCLSLINKVGLRFVAQSPVCLLLCPLVVTDGQFASWLWLGSRTLPSFQPSPKSKKTVFSKALPSFRWPYHKSMKQLASCSRVMDLFTIACDSYKTMRSELHHKLISSTRINGSLQLNRNPSY